MFKIPYLSANDILKHYADHDALSALVEPDMLPNELIQRAMEFKLYPDIVKYLAHALPVRDAIWWAVTCAEKTQGWNKDEQQAIKAARNWVQQPDEKNRRYAEYMAEKSSLNTGAGWAAQAAFWSGGSMTKSDTPSVPPPPFLYAQAVSGCITLCAVQSDSSKSEIMMNEFITLGVKLAQGHPSLKA